MKRDHIIVLGNGPSLADIDLYTLADFPTIGMNAAYRYWDRIGWYPKYYACLDDQVVVSHQVQIKRLIHDHKCECFFLHQNILRMFPGLAAYPNVFILSSFLDNANHVDARIKTLVPVLDFKHIRSYRTVKVTTGVMATRFAAYLGYKKIMLLGVDANYLEIVDGASLKGGIVLEMERTPAKNPNYFFEDYQQAGDRYNLPTPTAYEGNMHLDVFRDARADLAEIDSQIKIFVGTKKSEIYQQNVLPYIDPDEFIERGHRQTVDIRIPSKEAAQPSYVPITKGQVLFARIKELGGVQQTGCNAWTWPRDSSGFETASLGFVFAKLGGFNPGDFLSVNVLLATSEKVRARLRVCRDGDTPYEGTDFQKNILAADSITISLPIKQKHQFIRFEISLEKPAMLYAENVIAECTSI